MRAVASLVGIGLLVFALLFARSMTRFFDLDEHQFVAPPILLVGQGALPYVDYPYFHMPTLVYLYAAVLGPAPAKLLAARTVSALCGTVTLLLLLVAAWDILQGLPRRLRVLFAGGLVLVYLSSRLFTYTNGWAWNHDPAVLCLVGAALLYRRSLLRVQGGLFALAAAGFLVGLAIGIRLSLALAFVPFVVSLALEPSRAVRRRLAGLAVAVLGGVVALLPAIVPMLVVPERFFFGNLGYPRLNTRFYQEIGSPATTMSGKLYHLLQTFLTDPGNANLFLATLWALVCIARTGAWRRVEQAHLRLLLGLLPALAIGALGPTPTQYQYYYILLPVMFLLVIEAFAIAAANPPGRKRLAQVAAVAALLTVGSSFPRWYACVFDLIDPSRWVPLAVHRTGEWVRQHVPEGGRVLTIDPLLPLEAGVEVYPEFAVGRFVRHVGPLLDADECRRQNLPWGEQFDRLLAARPPDAVLLGDRTAGPDSPLREYARQHGFVPLRSPAGDCELWVRCAAESHPPNPPPRSGEGGARGVRLPLPASGWGLGGGVASYRLPVLTTCERSATCGDRGRR